MAADMKCVVPIDYKTGKPYCVARIVHVFRARYWILGCGDESTLYALMYGYGA